MEIEKLIEQLRTESLYADKASLEIMDLCMEAADALSTFQTENESLKEKLYDGEGVNLVDYWMQQAKIEENGHRNCQAENEKLRAELEQMAACIYYKPGGLCRYGGDDPANVCVLGPCAHEVAAQKFIAEGVAEKGDRDHPAPPDPLTQEQLREMVGHWVWVLVNYEHNGEAFQCDGWALVATPCRVAYLDQEFPVSELGTRFQAYTQPVSNFRVRFMRNREGMAADEESE